NLQFNRFSYNSDQRSWSVDVGFPTAKDPVTAQSGLVILAVAEGQKRYVQAEMELAGGTPAGIALRRPATAVNNAVNMLVVPVPAAQQVDLLLATVDLRGSATVTAPAGWTLIWRDINGTAVRKATYWRIVDTTEPATYTWQFSAARSAVGLTSAYSGVLGTAPIHASGGQVNTSSTRSITAPSLTTTTPDALVVGLFGLARGAPFAPPMEMTKRTDVRSPSSVTNPVSAETADYTPVVAEATGTKAATSTVAGPSVGQLVALAPSDWAHVA
ncbi:MAG: hypothetical protein M3332_02885, partial [Actinomycetota bacterium]|nr:hypothetical protein [Actinomycetota bacterium]